MESRRTSTIWGGILAVLFGIILIAMPGIAIGTLILLFALYLILYGAIRLYDSIRAPEGSKYRLPWLIVGAVAILGGLGLIIYPGISIVLLAYYIAFYAIIIGLLELFAGFAVRGNIWKEILIIIAGALSVLFGFYLFIYPSIGTALLVVILGWYSLIYGVLLIIYGFMRRPQSSY